MKINWSKTKYMSTDMDEERELTIELDGVSPSRVTNFKYLGSITHSSYHFDREIGHRFQR